MRDGRLYARFFFCLLLSMLCLLGACKGERVKNTSESPKVRLLRVSPRTVSLSVELSGRVSAFKKAEVRPQVGGILQKQLFTEGSLVHEGQSLYKIDPATYEAEVRSARAELARALASLTQTKLQRDRRRGLLGSHAVSKQAVEDAEAEFQKADADVELARARLMTAEIRLRYTDVLAPITGRIGKSQVTQGALVTANQSEPLAVIHQLDPVYVDMTRSSHELLHLKERYARGEIKHGHSGESAVSLFLEDGMAYGTKGKLQFADISVDESTGMVLLRAVFPNPRNVLLPGLYVRAHVSEGTEENVLCVPERAIQRNARGQASVFVVDEKKIAHVRLIQTAERVGRERIVSEGLSAGDQVVIEGYRRLKEGDHVAVESLTSEQK